MENGKKNNILTLEELVGGMTDVCSWADLLPDYDKETLMVHYSNTSTGVICYNNTEWGLLCNHDSP